MLLASSVSRVSFASYARMMLPSVWSSLFRVNRHEFGTFVSLVMLIFFSPSNSKKDSKAGGAFIFSLSTRINRNQATTSGSFRSSQRLLLIVSGFANSFLMHQRRLLVWRVYQNLNFPTLFLILPLFSLLHSAFLFNFTALFIFLTPAHVLL